MNDRWINILTRVNNVNADLVAIVRPELAARDFIIFMYVASIRWWKFPTSMANDALIDRPRAVEHSALYRFEF